MAEEGKEIKLSEREHPLYGDNLSSWTLYKNSVDGGDEFINDDNLFSHRLEEANDFEERLDRAYYLNFCELIPNLYNCFIFKEKIERPSDEILEEFRKDCDGRGTSITDFIKKAGFFAKVYGVVHILIDIPQVTGGKTKINKRLAKEKRIAPYCTLIYPTQLKDWSVDKDGNFNWVLIEMPYNRDMDPTIERVEETHYKLITKEEWRVEDDNGEEVDFEDDSPSSGTNDFGFVPMVTLYHKYYEDNKIGKSLLKDIVYINRAIMNWCSCLDEQVERQTFSQLVVPDDGTLAEASETGDDPLHKIGTSYIWTFNANSNQPPQFISPNVENLQTVWQIIIDHTKEIFRLGGLVGVSEDLYVSRSGRSAQMGFVSVNAALSDTSYALQQCENAMSKIVYTMLNKNIEEYEDVKYPTTFDIVELSSEIDSFMKIMERNFSTTLNKSIQKTIARRATPLSPQSEREAIEQEIESGTGIVNPIKANPFGQDGNMDVVDDGSGNPNPKRVAQTFKTKDEQETEEEGHRSVEK
jgi:hypothetical protein